VPLLDRHIISLGYLFIPCHKKSFLLSLSSEALINSAEYATSLREASNHLAAGLVEYSTHIPVLRTSLWWRQITPLPTRLNIASSRVKLELLRGIHEVLHGLLRANSCGLCWLIETLLSDIARVAVVILREGAPTSHAHS